MRSHITALAMSSGPRIAVFTVAVVAGTLSASIAAAAGQLATAPRLREGHLPSQIPDAFGGGEVVLELTVGPRGAVARVERVRVTPPYTDLMASTAAGWRFEPGTVTIGGNPASVAAPVLVVGIFRPASFYAGPAPGVPPQTVREPSTRLPRVRSMVMPAYPPTATGNGIVLVEIEMNGRTEPRTYRIVGPASGFDTAALGAVRAWKFDAPPASDAPDPLFVYAVVGFRTPLAAVTPPRR